APSRVIHCRSHHAIFLQRSRRPPSLHSFPTRRSSDLTSLLTARMLGATKSRAIGARSRAGSKLAFGCSDGLIVIAAAERELRSRSEEHTSELQSLTNLVCRLLLAKQKNQQHPNNPAPP